jgi:Bacterial protein of unknown function (DUF916)
MNNKLPLKSITSVLCALAVWAVAFAATAAAAPPQLAVTVQQASGEPVSYLTVQSDAGARSAGGTVFVTNEDKHPVTVDIAPVSAETAANLGSAYALDNEQRRGAATWLRTSIQHVSLAPGESAEVDVAVDVPAQEADGEYLAGVSIEARGQGEGAGKDGEVAIASAQRYVVGVQVDVGSVRTPQLAFAGAEVKREPAGVTFLLEMKNPGNVILQNVEGRVEVERDGRRIASAPIGPGTFVTGTAIEFPVLAENEDPPEGTDYRVRAVARYEGGEATLDEVVTFGHEAAVRQEQFGGRPAAGDGFPWVTVGAGAIGLLLLALAAAHRRRSRDLPLPGWEGTIALIDRELVAPGAGPLTAIGIGPLPADPALRQTLLTALSGRMRVTDVLTEPVPGTVAIVAPNTSETAAIALIEDAQRLVGYVGGATRVVSRTAAPPAAGGEILSDLLAGLQAEMYPTLA